MKNSLFNYAAIDMMVRFNAKIANSTSDAEKNVNNTLIHNMCLKLRASIEGSAWNEKKKQMISSDS